MAKVRPIGRRKPRTAFVLSGGGNLGATQVGMLRALVDHGIAADLVLGCSVGALNGGAYAADPTVDGVARLEEVWRGMRSHDLMPSSRIPSPLQLIRKGESIHSNHGLLRTVIEFLGDRDTFEELAVPFQCVATDVDLATEQWFDSGRLIEPILASAALPAVYPMVHIAGRRYLDGGVVNNVPLARAVELGAKKIFVLHVGLHGRPHAEVRRPLDAALIAYWIARNNRFQRDLAALPRSIEVVVLPPGDRPEVRYDDFDQTEDLMTQGYERAATYLDELDAAEAKEPRLAERLRLDMFKTAEWRPGARRRAADGTNTDGVPADGGIEDPADTNDEAPEVMS